MAIVHFAYLFDSADFQGEIAPLISELDAGNYRALRQQAWRVAQNKPKIWKILENHFYGPDNFQSEYEDPKHPNTSFWFLVILSQFLHPISSFSLVPTWQDQYLRTELLRSGLVLVGWDERDCILLIWGMSPCSLLLPERVTELIAQERIKGLVERGAWVRSKQGHWEQAHWCAFEGGWLDQGSIKRLHRKLLESREDYLALFSHPEPILPQWGEDILKGDTHRLLELLQTSYEDAERMLVTAEEHDKCLFMITS